VRADWPFLRCVLCLRGEDPAVPGTRITSAHVIPKSVGGRLEAPTLTLTESQFALAALASLCAGEREPVEILRRL